MANTYTMDVNEGLAELKILHERIEKEIRKTTFVTTNKHSNTKIDGMSIEDYKKQMTSSYQRIRDLIKRRDAIKRAITKSNAVTTVSLTKPDGKTITMTVAELIEYKELGIKYTEMLLNAISNQFERATNETKYENGTVLEERANKHILGLFGSKETTASDAIAKSRADFIEINTLDMIDPNNAAKIIDDLNDTIDFYRTKVDAALTTSNAITKITFEA